jgi:ribose 5-phosphate isomerase A
MSADTEKRLAAEAAVAFVPEDAVLGVGTGSTVDHFIRALATRRVRIRAAVSSSLKSSALLRELRFDVLDLNEAGELELYVDGADEATAGLELTKGGGAALTREKIVAAASRRFVCIADSSKLVARLGAFPLPVEVIPMARSYVARELVKLGGQPVLREGIITDNGNVIVDVHHLDIVDPAALEATINGIVGVVDNGLFARRRADVLLIGRGGSVQRIERG